MMWVVQTKLFEFCQVGVFINECSRETSLAGVDDKAIRYKWFTVVDNDTGGNYGRRRYSI